MPRIISTSQKTKADEERQLPDTAKLDVLIALVAEPPVQVRGHPALQRHELATEGTDHHDDQRPEEHVHTQLLVLGILAAVDDGDEEQASSQEAGGDPEDGGLDVPGAGQRVRQVLGERNAVEVLTFNRVVGGGATQQHLHQEEGGHDQQILAERLLRGGELDQRQRVGLGSLDLDVLLVGEEGPDQMMRPIPKISVTTEAIDQITFSGVGSLPIRGSCGQLLV